jgi:hypothetical protein
VRHVCEILRAEGRVGEPLVVAGSPCDLLCFAHIAHRPNPATNEASSQTGIGAAGDLEPPPPARNGPPTSQGPGWAISRLAGSVSVPGRVSPAGAALTGTPPCAIEAICGQGAGTAGAESLIQSRSIPKPVG